MTNDISAAHLRVLMFSWEYPPHVVGGLGAHVAALVPALSRAGVQVHVVTPRWAGGAALESLPISSKSEPVRAEGDKPCAGGSECPQSAEIYRVDPQAYQANDFFTTAMETNKLLELQARAIFEQLGCFDVIHAHDWLVQTSAAAVKHAFKIPLVATVHATERGRGQGHLSGALAESINQTEWMLTYEAWRVICASQFMAGEVKSYFQVPPDKIDLVPNGVDMAPFDALEGDDLKGFRALWAQPDQSIVFSVGRLVHEKGAHLLVEAAPRILDELPGTRFIIAGTGGMSDHIKRRVWELGIVDQVRMAGFISDPDRDRLLKVSDVAVFPSLYEPFGIVALEGMAAKCPVVVSSVGGLAEVVENGVTGLTVRPNDADALALGILETLRHPVQARERARAAFKMAKTRYNWDRIAAQTIQVYERVVRERASVQW